MYISKHIYKLEIWRTPYSASIFRSILESQALKWRHFWHTNMLSSYYSSFSSPFPSFSYPAPPSPPPSPPSPTLLRLFLLLLFIILCQLHLQAQLQGVQDSRLKTQDSNVFIWPLFTFSQIEYNKQLHKFLIYMVNETSIKTTCGRWHRSHLYGNENTNSESIP